MPPAAAADLIDVPPEPTDPAPLIERDGEVAVIRQLITDAAGGHGGAVVLEGPTGMGISTLLATGHRLARASGLLCLSTRGSELGQDFPFGLAIRLYEPLWANHPAAADPEAFAGPVALAAALLRHRGIDVAPEDGDRWFAVIQGLLMASQNLAQAGSGLALIVDDLQWSDAASLRFLAYLGESVAELPIALLVGGRPARAVADRPALTGLRRLATTQVLRPAPLSGDGVSGFVRRRYPNAAPGFIAACARATAGVPGLLSELVGECSRRKLAPTAANAFGVSDIVPEGIVEMVRTELETMSAPARRVAEGAAVLGTGATVREVGRLGELETEQLLSAVDELVAGGILSPGLPTFAAPILRSAVAASLSAARRAQIHLQAARILTQTGADVSRIADQLLHTPPTGFDQALPPLCEAARRALHAGAADRAVKLLQRALAEDPEPTIRAEILADLGTAEARCGTPTAAERFSEARRLTGDPSRRAQLAVAQSEILYAGGDYRVAAGELAAAARELGDGDPDLGLELTARYVANAALVPELHHRALELRERLLSGLRDDLTPRQRAAVAHTVVLDAALGAPRARVRELAELVGSDGLVPAEPGLEMAGVLVCLGLVIADELELAIEHADRLLEAVAAPRQTHLDQALTCVRAWAHYHQGDINAAETDANLALGIDSDEETSFARFALAIIGCCHIQRGQLNQAAAELSRLEPLEGQPPLAQALMLDIRAQLRLAELAPEAALEDATAAGALMESLLPGASPGLIPWRSRSALVQLALGQPARAEELAETELANARRIGLTASVVRGLRITGLALGPRGITRLAEAAAVGDAHPTRLEHIRALIDYGAALRRRNQRSDAREPLRRGLDLSHRGGASRLEARARTELTASGGRPRRPAASGLDSLTVSQRRVAELAARGLTTRQIAEALFVRPKTVEFHLRQTYMKLGVNTREGLADLVLAA